MEDGGRREVGLVWLRSRAHGFLACVYRAADEEPPGVSPEDLMGGFRWGAIGEEPRLWRNPMSVLDGLHPLDGMDALLPEERYFLEGLLRGPVLELLTWEGDDHPRDENGKVIPGRWPRRGRRRSAWGPGERIDLVDFSDTLRCVVAPPWIERGDRVFGDSPYLIVLGVDSPRCIAGIFARNPRDDSFTPLFVRD